MNLKVMRRSENWVSQLLAWLVLAKILGVSAVFAPPASAQTITPAPDSTGTIVTPAGNQFNISGGTQAGANLYQSFQQFGLNSNQIATFLSRPDIQNILGRVVGGDASVINGLVQVTGGNSNLYLLNPAGIIFGANASLNVPTSFTATTANGIQVGNSWFKASGTNDYATLNGSPNGFAFTQSGTIFNAGTLTVGSGQSLTLVGGTVVNLGTIASTGGTITIAAIPGEKLVRITQAGSLLSLDLPIDTKAQLNPSSSVPLNLPALLTGSTLANATGVTVDNGVVKLASSGAVIPTDAGVAIVSGTVSVAPSSLPSLPSPPSPSLPPSPLPQITILGDKVGLLNANVDASGTNGGGTILIGGDFQGKGTVPNARFTVVDAGTTIAADALTTGDGGKVILWADQATRFLGNISARGGALGGNGGLVETSGKVYLQALGTVDSSAVNGTAGTWLLDPNNITIQTAGPDTNVTGNPNFTTTDDNAIVTTGSIQTALNGGTSVTVATTSAGANTQAGDITVANNITKTAGGDATLTLNAQNSIFVNSGVQITSTANKLNVVMRGDSDSNGDGAIVLNNGSGITTNGGDIVLNGQGNAVNIEGLILNNTALNTGAGNISLIGTGQTGTAGATGIYLLNGSNLQTTTGIITFIGTGGAGTSTNYGVYLDSSTITTADGTIFITGTGGAGSAGDNYGIYQTNIARISSSNGSITLNGTGGAGTSLNFGIFLNSTGTSISTVNGAISLTGTGSGNGSDGILQSGGAAITSTGTGPIALTGTGGAGINVNYGVFITDSGTSISTVDGAISVTGIGGAGTGNDNYGIDHANNAAITSTGNGTITLNGTGGVGVNTNFGIFLNSNSTISTVGAAISLIGMSAGTGSDNYGILQSRATITSTGTGPITLQGTGAGTADGIITAGAGNVIGGATANGDITLTADRMTLDNVTIQGNRNLLIQPLIPSTSIGIGDPPLSTGTLNLNSTELANLVNGFNQITIGGPNSSGTITLGSALTFNDSITIQAPGTGGTIFATPGATIATIGNAVNLLAAGDITTQAITTGGGALSLVSLAGSVGTNGQSLDTSGAAVGGSITLTALNNISLNNLVTTSSAVGGDVTLISSQGFIFSNDIRTTGTVAGGDVMIMSADTTLYNIVARAIDTSSTSGNGGNVTLDSPIAVGVSYINAQGGSSGLGGNVNISTVTNPGSFRASGSFVDQNGITASISTAGGTGGAITIRHGGNGTTPFVVGNAIINGTAAAITSGTGNTIAPTQSFLSTYIQGNISLITSSTGTTSPSVPDVTGTTSPSVPDVGVLDTLDLEETLTTHPNEDSSSEASLTEAPQGVSSGEVADLAVGELETEFTSDYSNYFGLLAETPVTPTQIQGTLNTIESATGVKSALIYISFVPATPAPAAALPKSAQPKSLPTSPPILPEVLWQSDSQGFAFSPASELRTLSQRSQARRDNDILQIIVVTGKEKRILKQIPETTRGQVIELAQKFRQEITNVDSNDYLVPGQKLYQLLIAPIEPELQSRKVGNLVFIPDAGLRSLPLAALHDGRHFLVETYSVGVMPSFSLSDTRYRSIKRASVLAMGASKFTEQIPLVAVPAELAAIVKTRSGETFLNEAFTLENIKAQRIKQPFSILHLATHGEFKPGEPANSYIQLWDTKLRMDQIQQLQLSNPSVDLLVLSACRTAVGDDQAELGFAGFAVQSGVKSVLASLWYVSDGGTLGLMNEFYQQLQTAPIKAEALRRAQIAMIRGQVRLERGELRGSRGGTALPPELVALGDTPLSHPYYWAAFTMIGNPW